MSKIKKCPKTGLPMIDFDGERRLGTIPRTGPQLMRSAKGVVPDIPKSDWREINRRKTMPWNIDQKSHSSCTGHGTAGGLMRARRLRGLTHFLLSGTYPYSFVNGGRDNGAVIHELLPVIRDKGTCLYDQCTWSQIYRSQYDTTKCDTTAKRFRAADAVYVDNFSQIISGLLSDWIPVFAVQVGSRFTTLDSKGRCGFDSGPGNHCVHGDGIKLIDGDYTIDMMNSWGLSFGEQGRGYITERHIDGIGYQDIYLVQAAIEDPEDPDPLPPAKE